MKKSSISTFIVYPERIVWQSPQAGGVVNTGTLLRESSGQVSMWSENGCVIRTKNKPVGMLLDFGREIHGGVRIFVSKTKDRKTFNLRIRFGESVSEVMNSPNTDHAVHDITIPVLWACRNSFGDTGFRFVRIDLLDQNAEVTITEIQAECRIRDMEYRGSFSCSDPLLDKIWHTGAYTVHLNMQEYLWDGIKRDRLVWMGDMHPETLVVSTVFGENEVVPKSLDLTRDETELPKVMNRIGSYSLWWIIIQWEWFFYHGNLEYLKQQQDYLSGLVDMLSTWISSKNCEMLPETRFLDWPTNGDTEAIHIGLQSLMIMAFKAAGKIFKILKLKNKAELCSICIKKLSLADLPESDVKQANSLRVLAGLGDAKEINRTQLAVKPFDGLSTFYGYYVLDARALAGDYKGCLNVIRKYWGGMLKLGATTFWEDFDLSWMKNAGRIDEITPKGKIDVHKTYGNYCYKGFRHSLCHGWSAGPTAWLTKHVLGITPTKPGCRELQISPNLCDLDWAEGTFPTPKGIVKIRAEKSASGHTKTKVDAPKGIKINLAN